MRHNPRSQTVEFSRTPSNGGRKTDDDNAPRENVIYRIHPTLESRQLIFQLGTASPELAVQAGHLVAPHVAGIDINAGCPKPFSTSGGMGAALLSTPDLLCEILTKLVQEVGAKWEIGISVKIRLLSTEAETKALVEKLCATGITGLTIHCRTRSMRKTERAIRDQLSMVGEVCRNFGVACLMNGDVEGRTQALQLAQDFSVDGAMIATAAEKNPSCFRTEGVAPWRDVVAAYMDAAIAVENRWGNTKFLLAQMMPGKEQNKVGLGQARNYEHICQVLGLADSVVEKAAHLDRMLGLEGRETKSEQKKSKKRGADVKTEVAADDEREAKKQKQQMDKEERSEIGPSDANGEEFLTDLHHDIVAPSSGVTA